MNSQARSNFRLVEDENSVESPGKFDATPEHRQSAVLLSVQTKAAPWTETIGDQAGNDRLLTAEEVATRLNVTKDWIWDHSSRKAPFLPVIRIGDGTLRYRASKIEEFINERERLSVMRRKRR